MICHKLICGLFLVGCGCVMSLAAHAGMRDYQKAIPQGFGTFEEHITNTTIAGVRNNTCEGQLVAIEGRLTQYLGRELFAFADKTGQITVELDDDHDWSYLSKNDLIRLVGVVERGFASTRIEAKQAFILEDTAKQ